jgi:hypothetical protein
VADNRLTFLLDGRDRLSQVLNRAGDSAGRLQRRIDDASRRSSAAMAGFTRDADGRLRDLNGRFVSAGAAARRMGDDVNSGSRRGGLGLRGLMSAVLGAGSALAGLAPSAGAAGGALKGIGIAAGVTALPAVGALIPMLAGAGLAAGTAKLAFGGVSEAVSLAGEDAEAYQEALKKMGPEQRKFTQTLVSAKKEFSGLGREVQKIVLPSFTEALRQARPALGIVRDGVRDMSKVFADFGTEFGKLFGSNRFQDALRRNLQLGADFFGQMTQPLTRFTQSILDFGAASKPTLDAFGRGIGDLLGKGLPGFFDGLKGGIKGSADMFTGLFNALNKVLPALGELVGAIANSAGPALRRLFEFAGTTGAGAFRVLAGAIRFLKPVFGEIGGAARIMSMALGTIGSIARNVGRVVLESLWPSFRQAESAVGPLQRLARWLKANESAVQEFARMASSVIIDFVGVAVRQLPNVIQGFRYMVTGVLTALDGIVSGAAMAFGWIPGLGGKLRRANADFDKFKNAFITGLHKAEDQSRKFANRVSPRLGKNKLRMNIDNWRSQIIRAERQLKNAKGEKKARLTGDIRDWRSKIAAAERRLRGMRPTSKTARIRGDASGLYRAVGGAKAALNSVRNRQIYITSYYRTVGKSPASGSPGTRAGRYADGGIVGRAADGLYIPGYAPRRDTELILASRGEGVLVPETVRKLGMASGLGPAGAIKAMNRWGRYGGSMGGGAASTHRRASRAAMVPARTAAPTIVNIHVDGALDPTAVARQIQKILKELKRNQGGGALGLA